MTDPAMIEIGASSVRVTPSLSKLSEALASARAELKNPPKESKNPHFGSKYADLATVIDTVLPVLAKFGLSVVQVPCDLGELPALTTFLLHASGERIESVIRLRPSKSDPQGIGSALTYLRRYSLIAIAGVAADDDDDGNAASRRGDGREESRRDSRPSKSSHERRRDLDPPKEPEPSAKPSTEEKPAEEKPAAVTSDDVFNLLDDLGERSGIPTTQLVTELLSKVPGVPASLDDLTPGQLRSAAAAVRKRLSTLPTNGQLPGMSGGGQTPTAALRH